MYSKVEISNIVVRGVEVKKSEIRLKSVTYIPANDFKIVYMYMGFM